MLGELETQVFCWIVARRSGIMTHTAIPGPELGHILVIGVLSQDGSWILGVVIEGLDLAYQLLLCWQGQGLSVWPGW